MIWPSTDPLLQSAVTAVITRFKINKTKKKYLLLYPYMTLLFMVHFFAHGTQRANVSHRPETWISVCSNGQEDNLGSCFFQAH